MGIALSSQLRITVNRVETLGAVSFSNAACRIAREGAESQNSDLQKIRLPYKRTPVCPSN